MNRSIYAARFAIGFVAIALLQTALVMFFLTGGALLLAPLVLVAGVSGVFGSIIGYSRSERYLFA